MQSNLKDAQDKAQRFAMKAEDFERKLKESDAQKEKYSII